MAIFSHVTLGTKDINAAEAFYDAALGALGIHNMGNMGGSTVLYGQEKPEFAILTPKNGEPATVANGGTLGFLAPNRDAVHKFHEAGLANGGTDEGQPGPRDVTPDAYGAYLLDPDGNKICAFSYTPE